MKLCVLLAPLAGVFVRPAEAASLEQVKRYDPETHVPNPSKGCGKDPPFSVGKTTVVKAKFVNVEWLFRIYLPKEYNKNRPVPIVFQFPGWGMSAEIEQSGSGITEHADSDDFVSVTPQGMNDNPNWGQWYSWNCVGTTQSPGPGGPTCTEAANHPDYCYTSCGSCGDNPQCDWTTCDDTITPSGTGRLKVDGYIAALYDTLEHHLCIDTTREFAAGESNGGMMAYQTGVDLAKRLAAIAPQFGSFHRGFNMVPDIGVPVIDIHGTKDTTVPANVSLSADGYYYTPTDEIFWGNDYSTGWAENNNCTGTRTHWETPLDGQYDLWCLSEGNCTGGDVVRCSWSGGHTWFGGAKDNGLLVTMFLLQWTRPSHKGFGRSVLEEEAADEPALLEFVELIDSELVDGLQEPSVDLAVAAVSEETDKMSHYGDPKKGCLPDEEVIELASGTSCAPMIGVEKEADGEEPPVPKCKIGGVSERDNGCPKDMGARTGSKAFPVCLAKGPSSDPYMDGQFHCLLSCPCPSGETVCGKAADSHCPGRARCRRGELMNGAMGVCTYDNDDDDNDDAAATVVV